MILAEAAKAAESAAAFGVAGIFSTILAFLSIPAVLSIISAAVGYFNPTTRLRKRLTLDLALHEKLAESDGRKELAANIELDLAKYNARRAPPAKGWRLQWLPAIAVPVGAILVASALVVAPDVVVDPARESERANLVAASFAGAVTFSIGLLISTRQSLRASHKARRRAKANRENRKTRSS